MEKKRTTFIYGLYDLDLPYIIRYVGKADDVQKRLTEHIYQTKNKVNNGENLSVKESWLLSIDYNVTYVIINECDYDIWPEMEIYYIDIYENLTNVSKGGLGGRTIIYTKSYDEVRNWVLENLKIKSMNAWIKMVRENKLPNFIPRWPRAVFSAKNEWISWGHFLNTGTVHNPLKNCTPYNEAKEIISKMGIKTIVEYTKLHKEGKISKEIPLKPNRRYKINNEWESWGEFLGPSAIKCQHREYLSYEEFKKELQRLKIKTYKQLVEYINSQNGTCNLRTHPERHYKDEWINWKEVKYHPE